MVNSCLAVNLLKCIKSWLCLGIYDCIKLLERSILEGTYYSGKYEYCKCNAPQSAAWVFTSYAVVKVGVWSVSQFLSVLKLKL